MTPRKPYQLNIARPVNRLKLSAPKVLEHPRQVQICHVLRLELAPPGKLSRDGVVWFSVDHAAYSGIPALRTSRGVIAGLADVWLLWRGGAFMVEIKTEEGEMSVAQRELAVAVLTAQCRYAIARDARDTVRVIDEWQIPRAHRIQEFG